MIAYIMIYIYIYTHSYGGTGVLPREVCFDCAGPVFFSSFPEDQQPESLIFLMG